MAFMKTVGKAEPIEPSADNGALDLSVSSPRRAPSASDRLSDTSPPRLLNSPPKGSSTAKVSSTPSAFDGISFSHKMPSHNIPQQTNTPPQIQRPVPAPHPQRMPPSVSAPLSHQPQQPRRSPTKAAPSASSSAVAPPLMTGGLDLEKLRSVHHVMQNRPNAASVMPQQQMRQHPTDGNRPKMPVPPQNRQVVSNTPSILRHGPPQTLKSPPPPGADNEDIVLGAANRSQVIHPVATRPQNVVQPTTDPQIIQTNSLIRIQPSGVLNWNGQHVQFLTNVRLPSGNKVSGLPPGSSVHLTTPQLLKLGPEMPVISSEPRTIVPQQQQQVTAHNKIQPKQAVPPKPREMPAILPAPNGNSSSSSTNNGTNGNNNNNLRPQTTQIGVIDSAAVSMAVQQARSVYQKSAMRHEQEMPSGSSNKLPISGKIPSPPSQIRYSQTHRPIMPKPCRPSQPQTQAPQPVIYLCTLPTAPVTAQPQQQQTQPVAPISAEPNNSSTSVQQAVTSSSTNNGGQTKAIMPFPSPIPIMEAILKNEHKTPPQTAAPPQAIEVPISIQIVTANPAPAIKDVSSSEKPAKEIVPVSSPGKKEPAGSESEKKESPERSPAKIGKEKRNSVVEEPLKKKAKESQTASPASSRKGAGVLRPKNAKNSAEKRKKKAKEIVKKPNIITHVIDGFVILESDQPILTGAMHPDDLEEQEIEEEQKEKLPSDESNVSLEKPIIALKRRRRISSTQSKASSAVPAPVQRPASSASNQGTPSPSGGAGAGGKCYKCKRQIPVSGRGVKSYNFKGSRLCGFRCYSQVRHEYATSSQKQKRKFNQIEQQVSNVAATKPQQPVPQQETNKKQVSPMPRVASTTTAASMRSVSPIKVAAMPPFLMSPLPTAPPPQQAAVISPATSASVPASACSNKPPNQWTVADVNDFIKSIPGCEEAAQKFLEQEIDGPALLLLKSEVMVQLMGLKIGPVLKITSRLVSLSSGTSSQQGRETSGAAVSTCASSTVGNSPPSAPRLIHPPQSSTISSSASSFPLVKQTPQTTQNQS